MTPTCVHFQAKYNLVKAGAERCPWCRALDAEARARKAEALLTDELSSWIATGSTLFAELHALEREWRLRMDLHRQFLETQDNPDGKAGT
jgi:hypothetical protein